METYLGQTVATARLQFANDRHIVFAAKVQVNESLFVPFGRNSNSSNFNPGQDLPLVECLSLRTIDLVSLRQEGADDQSQ